MQSVYAGRFNNVTSPAGKASRHLSGCGSQPELPQHFSVFAAGKATSTAPSNRLSNAFGSFAAGKASATGRCSKMAQSPTPDETDSPGAAVGNNDSSLPSHRLARSHTPDQTDSPVAASTGLSGSLQHAFSIFGKGSGTGPPSRLASIHTPHQTDGPGSARAQQQASLGAMEGSRRHDTPDNGSADCGGPRADLDDAAETAGNNASFYTSVDPGSTSPALKATSTSITSPFKEASTAPFHSENSIEQPAKRTVSAHFGSVPKRLKSIETDGLPADVSPFGVLGGLVSKLKPQRFVSDLDTLTHEDIDIDLGNSEDGDPDCVEEDDAAFTHQDEDSGEEQDHELSSMRHEPISGLEHVQPFASIANAAVANVEAASLHRFGMKQKGLQKAVKKGHDCKVLQQFAPPRRCKSQETRHPDHTVSSRTGDRRFPPILQHFACNVVASE